MEDKVEKQRYEKNHMRLFDLHMGDSRQTGIFILSMVYEFG